MQISLVLTILGNDNQGLVKGLSMLLREYHASWEESRLIHLSGKFAGLLKISLPEEQLIPLKQALNALENQGLKVIIEQVKTAVDTAHHLLTLEVLGQDRPSIIHDITQQLTNLQINIEKLESELRTAPMSNEQLFYAQLTLGLPKNVSRKEVRDQLEAMSDQLMIDFNFNKKD
ncbi:MAG: ACT domain protein [Cocleimonas sp.]|nr:ACT domain protein [Cocleimonas sp.]